MTGNRSHGPTVLVVDDDESQRVLLTRVLQRAGVESVHATGDAASVAAAVQVCDPDLIVTDLHLGAGDAFAVLENLSTDDPRWQTRRIVVVTGDTDPHVRTRLEALGVGAVVYKPFLIAELTATFRTLLATAAPSAEPAGVGATGAATQTSTAATTLPRPATTADAASSTATPDESRLVDVVRDLASARTVDEIAAVVRTAARRLTGADGATFVLRDGDRCHYLDEDAIAPLWKGQRFPITSCISGWAMLNHQAVVIEDIYADDRIPHDAYRPTFVHSLVMVPVRTADPVAAIGNYWAEHHRPTPEEVRLLQALADSTAVAMQNAHLYARLDGVREQSAELASSNEELRSFVYAVAHDVRAPLSTIQGFADLLATDDDPDPAEVRDAVTAIKASAASLANYVGDLLEFATADARELSGEVLALGELVDEVSGRLNDAIRQRDAQIHTTATVEIVGDRALLCQVLQNLVANAIAYTPDDRVPVIHVAVESGERCWELTVSDNGQGIPADEREAIFELFRRGSTGAHLTGTGLGLALCRRVAERHGGNITVRESPAGGAEFVVRLAQAQPA